MKRRQFLAGISIVTVWPLQLRAQQSTKRMRRIAALIGFAEDDPVTQRRVSAFLKAFADLGWTLDRDYTLEIRYGGGDAEKNRLFAKQLVALDPEVILVNSTSATAAVQRETSTIPVVFLTVSDPVGSGFVASLPRPGGNFTGFINVEGSVAGKWLELLRDVAPRTKRVGFMFNPATATYFDYYLKPFETAARAAGVIPMQLPVGSIDDIEQAFARSEPEDGMILISDPYLTVHRTRTNALALRFHVPVVSGVSQSGSLISYAPDTDDLFRRSASYMDKILRGASAADLPVQLPTKFELIVNLKTARTLGLEVPPNLLAAADEVIE